MIRCAREHGPASILQQAATKSAGEEILPRIAAPAAPPTIALLLCRENNRIMVEYALRDVKKPIGIAQWKTKRVDSVPRNLRLALPTVEQLERELAKG